MLSRPFWSPSGGVPVAFSVSEGLYRFRFGWRSRFLIIFQGVQVVELPERDSRCLYELLSFRSPEIVNKGICVTVCLSVS